MGNVVPAGGQSKAPLDPHVYLQELPQLVFSSLVRPGKFLKTVVCKSVEQGPCVVKIYRKPGEGSGASAAEVEASLLRIADRLNLLRQCLNLNEVRACMQCCYESCAMLGQVAAGVEGEGWCLAGVQFSGLHWSVCLKERWVDGCGCQLHLQAQPVADTCG